MTRFDGPFGDLSRFLEIPRVSGLSLSPDGAALAAVVQNLSPDRKKFLSSIWRIDPDGGAPVRLTRSADGESAAAYLADGSLLFTAKRPDPQAGKDDPAPDGAGLWTLPAAGGEARLLAAPPAGVDGVAVAREAGTVVLRVGVLPQAKDLAEDARRRKARKDADVGAILHEDPKVRFWDHQLGPDTKRLFAFTPPAPESAEQPELTDVSGDIGPALDGYDVTPDGRAVVASWEAKLPSGELRADLVVIDVATGERRTLASEPGYEYAHPLVSPDGRLVIAHRFRHGDYDRCFSSSLWLLPLDGSEPGRDPLPELDLWPQVQAWSHDGAAVYFVADELGRAPIFQLDLATGTVTRLTGDHGAYAQVQVAPDGTVYALRSAVDAPARPVRLASGVADQAPILLAAPGAELELPGRLENVVATAADGQEIHARLVLPEGEGPAPLLVFIHGGPHSSWNSWTWRWNPWVLARRGYAVLLPDPALSTGYGQQFSQRGWGEWGDKPFTDLMAVTDAVVARPDIDETRTAALGGSFGGYMANWVATHTDRFKAIVSHAGLWQLELKATSDAALFFRLEFGDIMERPERWQRNSPHRHVENIRTPMLVIHGDKDYRVPVGNALWQWYDLQRHDLDAKFLYFPDENHWVLKPQNSALWYETVAAFLAHKVLGEPWQQPELL
ncbi:S9 family peptidase [Actinospica robiniae]|uniref:S9 family peptidase n=1 Tax=Actinospica robiniae TaxID=304901 RepID=UPI0004267D0B|nr:S9 family peptidase [Actinospica robiniae]